MEAHWSELLRSVKWFGTHFSHVFEIFVIKFEKSRVVLHPFPSQIRCFIESAPCSFSNYISLLFFLLFLGFSEQIWKETVINFLLFKVTDMKRLTSPNPCCYLAIFFLSFNFIFFLEGPLNLFFHRRHGSFEKSKDSSFFIFFNIIVLEEILVLCLLLELGTFKNYMCSIHNLIMLLSYRFLNHFTNWCQLGWKIVSEFFARTPLIRLIFQNHLNIFRIYKIRFL